MLAPSEPPRRRPPSPRQSAPPTPLPIVRQPRWLKNLARLQRLNAAIAMGAIGAALGTYAFTVYQWQAWNQAARQLEDLRYQERSLQRSSAALEASLAAEAERSPLVLWNPKQTLFLKSTPKPAIPEAIETPATARRAPLPGSLLVY